MKESAPLVTCYRRASTDRQEMSVPDQLKLIAAYCEAKGYTLLYPDRYSDEGLSGTTFERRKGVMRLISDVQAGKHDFERVIILNESRWGRPEDPEDSTYYELLIKRAGVAIEYVQGENHEGVVGRITRAIRYDQASGFSKQLGQDVIRGSKTAVAAGFSPGGPPPFGYARMLYDAEGRPLQLLPAGEQKTLKSQKVRWVPGDPADVALVRRIFELSRTKGMKTVCQILNKEGIKSPEGGPWEATTLLYLLKNRAYVGERSYGGTKSSKRLQEKVICPLAHEPIIDREIFEEVQENMAGRALGKRANYTRSTYLLTSKLLCLKCGYNFFGKYMKSKGYRHDYYQCNGYEAHRVCSSFLIKRAPIEAWIKEKIREMIASKEYRKELINFLKESTQEEKQSRDGVKALRTEVKQLVKEIVQIQDELLQIPSKSLRERLLDREAKLEALSGRIEAIARAPKVKPIEEEIRKYFELIERAAKTLQSAAVEEQKRVVSYFLERGEVDRERREVRFYFFALPAARMITWPLGSAASIGGGERI